MDIMSPKCCTKEGALSTPRACSGRSSISNTGISIIKNKALAARWFSTAGLFGRNFMSGLDLGDFKERIQLAILPTLLTFHIGQ